MTVLQYLRLIRKGRTPIVSSLSGASYNCTRCHAHLGTCPEQPAFAHRKGCTWAAAMARVLVQQERAA